MNLIKSKVFFSKNSTQDKLSFIIGFMSEKIMKSSTTVNSSKSNQYILLLMKDYENKHLFIKKINDLYELNINETEINFINKNKHKKNILSRK